VFGGSHEGILITDRDGLIVAVNPAFTEITGFTAEEMIGSNPSVLSSGRHDPAFYRAMWEALTTTGYWQGEIWNRRKSGEVYPEWLAISAVPDEQGRLVNYIGVFSDVTGRKAAEEHIEFLALHDPLTRLPNRKLLLERLDSAVAAARRAGRRVGLLFVDLDDFKTINDSLGHLAGDEVLQQVADRLRCCVREADTLARFGGDEFMVVASDIHAPGDAAVVAEKLIDALKGTGCRRRAGSP
jgi:diguanylate cyclase (GGDEF)-like protein/PAS domain S-box-containing protein